MSTPVDQTADTGPVEPQEVPANGAPRRRFAPKRSRSSAAVDAPFDSGSGAAAPAVAGLAEAAGTKPSSDVSQEAEMPANSSLAPNPSSRAAREPSKASSRGSLLAAGKRAVPAPSARQEMSTDHTAPDEARPTAPEPARPARIRPPRRRGTVRVAELQPSVSPGATIGGVVDGGPEAPAPTQPSMSQGVPTPHADESHIGKIAATDQLRSGAATETPQVSRQTRSRRRPSRAATAATPNVDAVAPEVTQPEAEIPDDQRRDPYDSWRMDTDLVVSAPGGDLDGTEALARELLEMFAKPEPAPVEVPALPAAHQLGEPALPNTDAMAAHTAPSEVQLEAEALAASDLDTAASDEGRRRSRRGRRGGRGRRRGAELADDGPSEGIAETAALVALTTPVAVERDQVQQQVSATSSLSGELFDAGEPARPTRSWRDRGPQRRWDRTFPRQTQAAIAMPPPKPSNGARFAPIPQALPPRGDTAVMTQPAARALLPFEMPDLRVGEPLGPGETRTERLLEMQTRLLQAMLEGQARQLEALTSSVAGLHQAVRDISAAAGSRSYQPRTGIFVDAPNVCYAADNARVSLDFGRMLKYLARDRHIVHALSYSPIIDDVREGIRYETQRFVAPFLRTGYKLVTKPLKRFSDGSAKGNFDIELALDIITMAKRLDVVVLVSGDSDFESVIEHIQSNGVRVEVVAFASNVSTELVNVADTFIDIGQHLEHFKQI